jgi:hypothetical protein
LLISASGQPGIWRIEVIAGCTGRGTVDAHPGSDLDEFLTDGERLTQTLKSAHASTTRYGLPVATEQERTLRPLLGDGWFSSVL